MLNLLRKIETEEEAEQVLNISYQMMAPLGVPTLIIDPADYDPRRTMWCVDKHDTIENQLKVRLQDVLHEFYGPHHEPVKNFNDAPGNFWMSLLNKIDYCVHTQQMIAHSIVKDELFNVVICPRTNNTGAMLMKHGLKMPEEHIADIPGTDIEWNFIRLWHEFGHGLRGASEAEADKVSALIYQHFFSDPQTLMVLSDFRATWAMINHEQPQALRARGWSLVDTLDQVVDGFGGQSSWHHTLEKIYHPAPAKDHTEDVMRVGRHLKDICKTAFKEPDLLMLSMMADHAALKSQFDNDNQLRIARRFSIAAQRLSIGRPAYEATAPKMKL